MWFSNQLIVRKMKYRDLFTKFKMTGLNLESIKTFRNHNTLLTFTTSQEKGKRIKIIRSIIYLKQSSFLSELCNSHLMTYSTYQSNTRLDRVLLFLRYLMRFYLLTHCPIQKFLAGWEKGRLTGSRFEFR